MTRWTAGLLLASLAAAAAAQPAIVPAEHAVYGWLADQRVAGLLPEFEFETLPTDRAAVRRHLDSLSVRADRLGPAGREWLRTFRDEFDEPLARVHSFVGDGTADLLDPDAIRTLGYLRDDAWRVAVAAEGTVESRTAEGAIDASGVSRSARLTIDGSYRGRVGFYSSTVTGVQITGSAQVLAGDPGLAPLYYVARDPDNVNGAFDQTSASVRVVGGPFALELANERLRLGPSADAPLVLADAADYLPFLRASLRTRRVTLEGIHAALSSRSVQVVEPDGDRFIDGPERYLAAQRLVVRPTDWWSVGYTGLLVYGRRGPELAYLNPFYPAKMAEHALYDRDNSLFALETVVRPLAGVEAYGTWLVDDLAGGTLGDGRFDNKWAAQAGLQAGLPALGATAFAEYTRVEPYTYSHRFREDGFFFNSYVHNGFSLGHPIGPNSDQWLAGVQTWLPFRTRARLSGRYVRTGENPVDPVTGEVTQVGGDVRLGTAPEDGSKTFLSGDRFEGLGARAVIEATPHRALALRLYGDVQTWDRRATDVFIRFGIAVRP